jgi:hypothetical protein
VFNESARSDAEKINSRTAERSVVIRAV